MKLIIMLLLSYTAQATNYYVSNAGSDAANGTSTGTAWQTLAKVQSTVVSNDSVFFKRGDVWKERIIVPANNIYYGYYGSGSKPLISAFQDETGFTQNGNIYTKTLTNAPVYLNLVYIDGALRGKARYPNASFLPYNYNYTSVSKIVGYNISGDYTGAEVVVKGANWVLDVATINSQVVDSFYLVSPVTRYNTGNTYFLQNSLLALDVPYEWVYNYTTHVLSIYANSTPTVKISIFDTLVKVQKKNNITFDGLSFEGANFTQIMCDTSNYMTIKDCDFNNSGAYQIKCVKSDYGIIKRCSITNSFSSAVTFRGSSFNICHYWTVDSNNVKNTGLKQGMGRNSDNADQALYILGNGSVVTNNRVDSGGYTGLHYLGKKCLIKNNWITNFCLAKQDGGGIYTAIGTFYTSDFSDSSIVRKNIVSNGGSALTPLVTGIYMDNLVRRQTIDSNTVFACGNGAISFHQANDNKLLNNIIIDTTIGCVIPSNTPATNNTIKGNFFYSTSPAIYFGVLAGYAGNYIDSNHYINLSANKFRNVNNYYSFAGWRALTGYDAHSDTITLTPTLFYNPTGSDSTIVMGGSYIDNSGIRYFGQLSLPPFESRLLFPAQFISNRKVGGFKFSSQ